MSQQSAINEAQRLKAIMAKHGVTATVELKIGRPWSGDQWYSRKQAVINHHTAGSLNGLTPSYALCRNGRSDLPGPLCNGYGGRDFVYRIITMGLGNHPGTGGPLTLAGFTIPKDSARISTWGTEWEHDGRSEWPAKMVDFMARANAAIDEFLAIPVERQIEHSTWAPKRKIDRNGYTAERGQGEIRAVAGCSPPTPVKPATKPAPKPVAKKANPYKVPVLTKARPLLRRGAKMTKDEAKYVQWAVGAVTDGDWGPNTDKAVKAWQTKNKLVSDALVGPKTLAALSKVTR